MKNNNLNYTVSLSLLYLGEVSGYLRHIIRLKHRHYINISSIQSNPPVSFPEFIYVATNMKAWKSRKNSIQISSF